MAGRAFISRFSPNRTDPAVLEAIFVQRHKLAEQWLDRLRESVLTPAKHHLLAVGPRGSGKTHLVSLLVHRLLSDPEVAGRGRVARLPEDETTASFWKFLLRILRALEAEYGREFPPPPRNQLASASEDRRSAILIDYLLEKLAGRPLLVVVENLDDAMRGLKDSGQKQWRSFLQEHRVAATLATAQRLSPAVSDRTKPFFGFFQVEHLRPLTAEEALALLTRIADEAGDASLAGFLRTPAGRARVRAIRHLTGGNHRVFIILSEFATRENLDDLVVAFNELLDELTPYYQERLRWLPDQQREIVEFLCRQARTVPVKDIAGELYLTAQSAASQLKDLKEKGYLASAAVGRESRYELAEPLMRLCVEVKDPRREPIRLIVDFLRIWYDRDALELRLQRLPADASLPRRHLQAALQLQQPDIPEPVQEALDRDLEDARASGDQEELVRVLTDLGGTSSDTRRCWAAASELIDLGRHEEALAAYDRATALDPQDADAWRGKGLVLDALGRYGEALAAYDRATALDPQGTDAWYNKGCALLDLGRHEEALAACEAAIKIDPGHAFAWNNIGWANLGLGRMPEAKIALLRASSLVPDLASARDGLAAVFIRLGNWDEAEAALEQRLRIPSGPNNPHPAWHLPAVLTTTFQASADRNTWDHRVGRLADITHEAQQERDQQPATHPAPAKPLSMLADALVRSLTSPVYAESLPGTLEAWAEVWQKVAEKHPDLSLAARLFGVGVRYVRTKDERVLLDLVQEERAILRDLFRLDPPA